MNKLLWHYVALFLCVTTLGFGCIATSLRIGGIGGLGYTILAAVLLWPLCGIGKMMLQYLKQN